MPLLPSVSRPDSRESESSSVSSLIHPLPKTSDQCEVSLPCESPPLCYSLLPPPPPPSLPPSLPSSPPSPSLPPSLPSSPPSPSLPPSLPGLSLRSRGSIWLHLSRHQGSDQLHQRPVSREARAVQYSTAGLCEEVRVGTLVEISSSAT